jgi:hypothetical protein
MKVAKQHSHLNSEEWLLVHQEACYQDVLDVIDAIDAEAYRAENDQEGSPYNPAALCAAFRAQFKERGWELRRYTRCLAQNYEQLQTMTHMDLFDQRAYLESLDVDVVCLENRFNHVKNGVAVAVQFGDSAAVTYDIFVKHLAFYTGRVTNVGVEILPTKAMQQEMSSGSAYYEGELHNILRHGCGSPSVPLVIIGIEPGG